MFIAGAEPGCKHRGASRAGNRLDAASHYLIANRTYGREHTVDSGFDAVGECAAVPADAGRRHVRVEAQRAAALEAELHAQVAVERGAYIFGDVGVLVDVRECDFVAGGQLRRRGQDEHVASEAAHGRADAAMVQAPNE